MRPRDLWGPVILIGAGALLLANNLSWEIPFRHLIREWWPALLIALGAHCIVEAAGRGHSVFGGILIALFGTALLISNLNPELSFGYLLRTYWPVLLIAGGLSHLATLNGWRRSRSSNPC